MGADGELPADAVERKKRSEAILRQKKIPFIDHLPVVESEAEVVLRDPQVVARRATCLALLAAKSEPQGWDIPAERILRDRGIWDETTPKERAYMARKQQPDERERAQFGWRYEGAWVLLWALGHITDEELGEPTGICDVPHLSQIVAQTPPEEFVGRAKLLPAKRILDLLDLTFRYHWAVVDARLNGKPMPAGLDPGVVYERHYALNWLTNYFDQAWDDVSTDT